MLPIKWIASFIMIFLNRRLKQYVTRQIKEVLESEYIDNEGRPGVRIEERFKRNGDEDPWQISDIWYATRTKAKAEKIEENQRYIKLVFPPSNNKQWQGNIFTRCHYNELSYLDGWRYEYVNVNEALDINGLSFDSTFGSGPE